MFNTAMARIVTIEDSMARIVTIENSMARLVTNEDSRQNSHSVIHQHTAVKHEANSTPSIFFSGDYDLANVTTPDYYYAEDVDLLDTPIGIFTIALFVVLSFIVLVIGLVGNSLVWFAVWRNPRMRSATNMFLVNLAVADFLVILICLPPTMAEDVTGVWYLGKEMCKIVKCLQKISVMVSVLTLTAISIERWMAICRPLMFRQTWVRAKRAIAIVWVISLAAGVPDAISLDLHPVSTHPSETLFYCGPTWSPDVETVHLWVNFVVFYLVPLAIMTFTYMKVAVCLWTSGMVDENDEASASVPRAQILLRRKKAKMLIAVVAMFAVCYLPVYVFFLFRYTDVLDLFPAQSIKPFILCSHWLCNFNSAINPTIYNFMSCNFRREFRIACHICCRRGSTHSSIYEALRLRKINKHRFHNNERLSCPSVNDNSCTLQTQITAMGACASSYSSLTPPFHVSTSSLATPKNTTTYSNGSGGRSPGDRKGSQTAGRGTTTTTTTTTKNNKNKIRLVILDRGHKDDS